MKGKVVLGVLAVTGILALSSTVAQAGGGIPVPLTSFFVCHGLIGASDQNQVVDAYSDNLGLPDAIRKGIAFGHAVLACAQANLFPANADPTPENEKSPRISGKELFELKCYAAQSGRKVGPDLYDVQSPLSGTEHGVQTTVDPLFVCEPAAFTAPPPQ